jgi:hypothetical protein
VFYSLLINRLYCYKHTEALRGSVSVSKFSIAPHCAYTGIYLTGHHCSTILLQTNMSQLSGEYPTQTTFVIEWCWLGQLQQEKGRREVDRSAESKHMVTCVTIVLLFTRHLYMLATVVVRIVKVQKLLCVGCASWLRKTQATTEFFRFLMRKS